MTKTRLSRRQDKKSKKTLYLTIIGIIAIFYLLFKFGLPLLVNLSLFISQIGKNEQSNTNNQQTYIAAPFLNPLPEATNSAEIIISGKAFEKQTISLYINNKLISKDNADKNGEFLFSENLEKGENEIKVKAKQENNESDFSSVSMIIFEDKAPDITIDYPSDEQSFGKGDGKINVSGNTSPDTNVTVNGFWATIDENNNFSYTFNLKEGENQINVVAIDKAGNKSEKSIKVSYSP